MNVLICDDDRKRAQQWVDLIRSVGRATRAFDLHTLEANDFDDAIKVLRGRQRAARLGKEVAASCRFDTADLLVVDFDLLKFNTEGSDTGETVAYLARCYSDCGYIIELNQFGRNWFDLTLSGRLESYADLNLGSDQLANPGLWSGQFGGFRPWSWPIVPEAVASLRKRTADVARHRNDTILGLLGLTPERVGILPRSTREFLTPRPDPEATTFAEFVTHSRYGLRPADRSRNEQQIARIAAARIGKWLEEMILAGQETLVDAPHLVERIPSLLRGPITQESLDRTTRITDSGAEIGLKESMIRDAQFTARSWLSRRAWHWFEITRMEELRENKSPWSTAEVPFGFCEDVSGFLPLGGCRQFIAEVDSAFNRRYVANIRADGGRRLAARYRSKVGRTDPRDIARVRYEPADRLAV